MSSCSQGPGPRRLHIRPPDARCPLVVDQHGDDLRCFREIAATLHVKQITAPQEDYQGEDGEGRRDGLQRSVLPMTGVRATLTLQQRTIKLDHFKISRKIPALFQSMKTVQNKF